MINIETNAWRVDHRVPGTFKRTRQVANVEEKAIKAVSQNLMEEMEAACVCVDEYFEVLYTAGKFKKYISIPDEGFTNNLMKLLPEEMVIPISMAVRKLAKGEPEPVSKNIQIVNGKEVKKVRLIVKNAGNQRRIAGFERRIAKYQRGVTITQRRATYR